MNRACAHAFLRAAEHRYVDRLGPMGIQKSQCHPVVLQYNNTNEPLRAMQIIIIAYLTTMFVRFAREFCVSHEQYIRKFLQIIVNG